MVTTRCFFTSCMNDWSFLGSAHKVMTSGFPELATNCENRTVFPLGLSINLRFFDAVGSMWFIFHDGPAVTWRQQPGCLHDSPFAPLEKSGATVHIVSLRR